MKNDTKLSVSEFRDFCDAMSFKEYIFDTYNQECLTKDKGILPSSIQIAMTFKNIEFPPFSRMVCFNNGVKNTLGYYADRLVIGQVRCIVIEEQLEQDYEGYVFYITCGRNTAISRVKKYKIIARK